MDILTVRRNKPAMDDQGEIFEACKTAANEMEARLTAPPTMMYPLVMIAAKRTERNRRMPMCPECEAEGHASELRTGGAWETDWYGRLTYYRCRVCGEHFVQQDDGEISLAAE